jgi:pimeloyl-ACP methyl ester carboxylesterase
MMRCEHFNVAGRPATAFVGGTGAPLVLIHGGWGGAAAHWSCIWDRLAERFLVIAPELPGVGDRTQPGLGGISDYAAWIEALLDARGIEAAVFVGNSARPGQRLDARPLAVEDMLGEATAWAASGSRSRASSARPAPGRPPARPLGSSRRGHRLGGLRLAVEGKLGQATAWAASGSPARSTACA